MITNENPSEEQISKNVTEVVPVQNQLTVTPATNNNEITRVSESSTEDEWSSSDENDGKQVAEIDQSRVPTINGAGINNDYTNCTGVTSTINNTNVYESGVTVNQNFYCCPFSLKQALKWPCKIKRKIIIPVAMVLAISFVVFLGVWLLTNLKVFNDVQGESTTENVSATTTVIPSSSTDLTTTATIIPSSSTISTTGSTVVPSSSINSTSSTIEVPSTTTDSSSSSTTTENPNHEWKIISREEWGAAPSNSIPKELPFLPPQYVILDETETDMCTTSQKCMEIVRTIQAAKLESSEPLGIMYNFLVGGDGMVYEGRGWDVHANVGDYDTDYFDHISIRVSLIGSFDVVEPSDIIIQATMSLLDFAVKNEKLIRRYKLLCVRQLSDTIENPGQKLFNVIKQLEKWDSRTIEDFPSIEFPENWEN